MRKLLFAAILALGATVAALGLGAPEEAHLQAGCAVFTGQTVAQDYLRRDPSDPLGLDPDRNGIACESLSCPCDRNTVARTVATSLVPTPVLPTLPTAVPATVTPTVPVPINPTERYFATTPDGKVETCPPGDEDAWRILYWQGPPTPPVTAIAACPTIDRLWVIQGRWMGYSVRGGRGNDEFFINPGEAVFTHTSPGAGRDLIGR
jgi:hypothetical protein